MKKKTEGDPAREVDERPHYFAVRLQKSSIEFYRTLPQATRENFEKCVKAFREHYSEHPVVFPGPLARRVQQPGEKLIDLEQLALKAYPTELQDIRDHLALRGFLVRINHSQVRLDLRKQIGDNQGDTFEIDSVQYLPDHDKKSNILTIVKFSDSITAKIVRAWNKKYLSSKLDRKRNLVVQLKFSCSVDLRQPVVFPGRLARRVPQPEKLIDFVEIYSNWL